MFPSLWRLLGRAFFDFGKWACPVCGRWNANRFEWCQFCAEGCRAAKR